MGPSHLILDSWSKTDTLTRRSRTPELNFKVDQAPHFKRSFHIPPHISNFQDSHFIEALATHQLFCLICENYLSLQACRFLFTPSIINALQFLCCQATRQTESSLDSVSVWHWSTFVQLLSYTHLHTYTQNEDDLILFFIACLQSDQSFQSLTTPLRLHINFHASSWELFTCDAHTVTRSHSSRVAPLRGIDLFCTFHAFSFRAGVRAVVPGGSP